MSEARERAFFFFFALFLFLILQSASALLNRGTACSPGRDTAKRQHADLMNQYIAAVQWRAGMQKGTPAGSDQIEMEQ